MALGVEIELARPVLDTNGGSLPGDTELYLMPELLKLVSDKRRVVVGGQPRAYSNAEFVTVHFDQHTGSGADAEAELRTRLAVVDLLRGDLYQDGANRLLSTAIRAPSTAAYDAFAQARFDQALRPAIGVPQLQRDALVAPLTYPIPGDAPNLLLHYTVGIAPELLGPALTALGALARNPGNSAQAHILAAQAVGQHCAGLLPAHAVQPAHLAEFQGYLALVFTQVAGFADIVAASNAQGAATGQPKNFVAVLSRVPLRTVFDSLHADVRAAVQTNAAAISGHIGATIIPAFADGDSRQVGTRAEITIDNYLRSALGLRPPVSQQRVFGGMNETGLDPTVHGANDPDPQTGRGIPLELRVHGTRYPAWAVFVAEAVALLHWSRQHAGLSDLPRSGSTDYWLRDVTAQLDDYEAAVAKLTGQAPLGHGESMFAVNWTVSSLNGSIAALLRAYPGFPGRPRGANWQPTALNDLACCVRYAAVTARIGHRIEGFTPDPFPNPVPPFDLTGPVVPAPVEAMDEDSDQESESS